MGRLRMSRDPTVSHARRPLVPRMQFSLGAMFIVILAIAPYLAVARIHRVLLLEAIAISAVVTVTSLAAVGYKSAQLLFLLLAASALVSILLVLCFGLVGAFLE